MLKVDCTVAAMAGRHHCCRGNWSCLKLFIFYFFPGNLRISTLICGSLPVTAGLIKVFRSAFAWHFIFKVNPGREITDTVMTETDICALNWFLSLRLIWSFVHTLTYWKESETKLFMTYQIEHFLKSSPCYNCLSLPLGVWSDTKFKLSHWELWSSTVFSSREKTWWENRLSSSKNALDLELFKMDVQDCGMKSPIKVKCH